MATLIIVVLSVLLIIGIVRSTKEKAQSGQVKNSPAPDQEETPYQTSQEVDQSYYQEVYASEEAQTEVVGEKLPTPKEKKAPVAKKVPAKKEAAPKKSALKKPVAKKAPAKKPTK